MAIMMVDRLRNAADYTKLVQEVGSDYLHEVTAKSPEYLLEIMAQIVEVFLAKLNIPLEEVDTFTSQIKERNMGELFAHFEGWDVQAIRKEAQMLARQQVEREVEETRKQVTKQVTQQVTESDIQKLLAVLHKLDCPPVRLPQSNWRSSMSWRMRSRLRRWMISGREVSTIIILTNSINKSYQSADTK